MAAETRSEVMESQDIQKNTLPETSKVDFKKQKETL
jgi:hypothetical protein